MALGLVYILETLLVNRTNLRAVTVVMDVVFSAIVVLSVVAVSLLNDGVIRPYFIVGEAMGAAAFALAADKAAAVVKKRKVLRAEKRKNKKSSMEKHSPSLSLGEFFKK